MHDLLIRNGRVVDGTGAAAFEGDVAVEGDTIVAVGRGLDGSARRTIDAAGAIVTGPGSSTSTRTTTGRPPGTTCSTRPQATARRP